MRNGGGQSATFLRVLGSLTVPKTNEDVIAKGYLITINMKMKRFKIKRIIPKDMSQNDGNLEIQGNIYKHIIIYCESH